MNKPTHTMAETCTAHSKWTILDMADQPRHMGGAWEPCVSAPPNDKESK